MSTKVINQSAMSIPTNNTLSGSATLSATSIARGSSTSISTTSNYPPYYSNGTINSNYYSTSSSLDLKHDKTIEFVEFLFKLLDIDLDYEQFDKMDDGERATFVRQHVINSIIK